MARLSRQFYMRDTVEVAKALLGKYLVRRLGGETLVCRITETEAYVGRTDKACHAYNYRRTPRTEVMFGEAGHAYIYLIYGMYNCLNFVTEPEGEPSAVLLRGVEVVHGVDTVSRLRFSKPYAELTSYQRKNFMNGCGKVCKGLSLTREENGADLLGDTLFLVDSPADIGLPPAEEETRAVRCGKRIGSDYAAEAADFLWRFYLA